MNNTAGLTNTLGSLNLVKEKAARAIDSTSLAPTDSKKKTKKPDVPDLAMSAYRFFFDKIKKSSRKLEMNCNYCGRDVKVHKRRDQGAFFNW